MLTTDDDVVPGAAVPVFVAGEMEDAGPFEIQRHVEIVRQLGRQSTGEAAEGSRLAAAPLISEDRLSTTTGSGPEGSAI